MSKLNRIKDLMKQAQDSLALEAELQKSLEAINEIVDIVEKDPRYEVDEDGVIAIPDEFEETITRSLEELMDINILKKEIAKNNGVSKSMVATFEHYLPKDTPLNSFTKSPTITNLNKLNVSLEETQWRLVATIVAAAIGVIMGIIGFISSKKHVSQLKKALDGLADAEKAIAREMEKANEMSNETKDSKIEHILKHLTDGMYLSFTRSSEGERFHNGFNELVQGRKDLIKELSGLFKKGTIENVYDFSKDEKEIKKELESILINMTGNISHSIFQEKIYNSITSLNIPNLDSTIKEVSNAFDAEEQARYIEATSNNVAKIVGWYIDKFSSTEMVKTLKLDYVRDFLEPYGKMVENIRKEEVAMWVVDDLENEGKIILDHKKELEKLQQTLKNDPRVENKSGNAMLVGIIIKSIIDIYTAYNKLTGLHNKILTRNLLKLEQLIKEVEGVGDKSESDDKDKEDKDKK